MLIDLPIKERKPHCKEHPQILRLWLSWRWPFISLCWSRHTCLCDVMDELKKAAMQRHVWDTLAELKNSKSLK